MIGGNELKVILVDDEQLALDYLEIQLGKIENIEILGKFTSPLAAIDQIINEEVDIVFLDIHLPEVNGIELAEKILEEKPEQTIVFVTAYDEYAIKAFELNAIDYLMKPVQLERLKETIRRVVEREKQPSPKKFPSLFIRVLGDFTIEINGEKSEFITWRTKKAEELFLYLLHHKDKLVRKSTLIELLWQEVELERANSLLYTTIYYVRQTLRPYHNHIRVKNASDGYVLETKDVVLDVEKWKKELASLPAINETTIERYTEVMQQYKGPYLQEYNYLWAEADQYRLEQQWLTVALEIANFYLQNNITQAKFWYSRICEFVPETEEAHFALMKIYAYENNHSQVHKQFETLTEVLKEELGMMPNSEVINWFKTWKKK